MEERLLKIMKHYNLSPSAFADKLKVQRSSISHLISGRNKPSFDFISRLLADFPEINLDWFVTGKGDMLKSIHGNAEYDLFSKKYKTRDEDTILDEQQIEKNNFSEVTNVNSVRLTNVKNVKSIIIYYNDHTWEEFLPAQK